jgi:transposase-like protein
MGRPIGTKNRTYSETDKEKILLEHYNDHISWKELCRKYNLSSSLVYDWDIKYKSKGVDGLKSNRGKHKNHHGDLYFRKPKNKIEELELELLKKDIEIARLKKGYTVKGVGAKKVFVTTLDKNIK